MMQGGGGIGGDGTGFVGVALKRAGHVDKGLLGLLQQSQPHDTGSRKVRRARGERLGRVSGLIF